MIEFPCAWESDEVCLEDAAPDSLWCDHHTAVALGRARSTSNPKSPIQDPKSPSPPPSSPLPPPSYRNLRIEDIPDVIDEVIARKRAEALRTAASEPLTRATGTRRTRSLASTGRTPLLPQGREKGPGDEGLTPPERVRSLVQRVEFGEKPLRHSATPPLRHPLLPRHSFLVPRSSHACAVHVRCRAVACGSVRKNRSGGAHGQQAFCPPNEAKPSFNEAISQKNPPQEARPGTPSLPHSVTPLLVPHTSCGTLSL